MIVLDALLLVVVLSMGVPVGVLSVQVLAAASGLLMDAVVCGHDGDYIGLLAWLNLGAAREVSGEPDAPIEALVRSPAVAERLRERLAAHNAEHPASSTRVERVLLLAEPPQLDADEITDKGYVNQRAVLARRRERVLELFTGGDAVILLP